MRTTDTELTSEIEVADATSSVSETPTPITIFEAPVVVDEAPRASTAEEIAGQLKELKEKREEAEHKEREKWLETQPAKVSRFKTAPWYASDYLVGSDITIGGAGGIGSWLAFYLARIGLSPTVWDFDMIEEHNLGGQLYSNSHIGVPKVVGLNAIIEDLCGPGHLNYEAEAFTEESYVGRICFSAFDNMAARKTLFTMWKDNFADAERAVFIDGRMLAEGGQVFCVRGNNPTQIAEYEKTLFADSEIAEQPCTMKATSHCGSFIAILMTSILTNWATNMEAEAKELTPVRETPFATRFELPLMMIETYEDSKSFV